MTRRDVIDRIKAMPEVVAYNTCITRWVHERNRHSSTYSIGLHYDDWRCIVAQERSWKAAYRRIMEQLTERRSGSEPSTSP